MKNSLNMNVYRVLLLTLSLLFSATLFSSCEDESKEKLEFVDLRYNPKDNYEFAAENSAAIEFEVRSSHPWSVFGAKDWYTITPASGDPDKVYKISVKASNNTELDDRKDTITIKSDHWVGKQFVVYQKGTARLTVDDKGQTIIESEASARTFSVSSNQNWTCKVTEGSEWLAITSGTSGSFDGDVQLTTSQNKGEVRSGKVTVYDRHNVEQAVITYQQKGVLLAPDRTEFRESYREHNITVKVESNTAWVIEKSEFDTWYTIETGMSYDGSADINIKLETNGVSLRKSELTLKTVSNDPTVLPVVKKVVIKQAPTPAAQRIEMNSGFMSSTIANGAPTFVDGDMVCGTGKNRVNLWLDNGKGLGTHSFQIKEMKKGSYPVWYTNAGWGSKEVRFHISTNDAKTSIGMFDIKGEFKGTDIPIDITKPHKLSLTVSEVDGCYFFQYMLDDGEYFASAMTDIAVTQRLLVYLGSNDGECVWDFYEYYPLTDWDF